MKKPLRWPISAIFAVVTGSSLAAAEISSYDPAENGQQVLTTLASIQAAVFAIVFSIIILGIQLSTSRYSARLADLFRSDSAYKKTVGIFAASLGIDVAALLAFTHVSTYTLRLLVFLSVGLAAASFTVLYFFVDRTLEQTTPEGIIKRVKQELTPRQIISDAEAADNDPSETDPFLVPVSIIRSAIDDRDLPAATRGLNVIDNQVEKLLEYTSTDHVEEDTPVGNSLEELSKNRLPNVAEKTVTEDLGEAGTKTVETLSSIGKNAVEQGQEPIVSHTSQGLNRLVASVDFDATRERLRKESIDQNNELLQNAAEEHLWTATGDGVRTLGWRTAQSVTKRGPADGSNRIYSSLALQYLPSIFTEVVEEVPNDLDEEEMLELPIVREGENSSPPEHWVLWSCHASMSEITSAFIRYESKHGEQIVNWEKVGQGWTHCISALNKSGFDSLLRSWLSTLLYLEYISFETGDDCMSDFHSSARFDVSKDVLHQTFDDILNGDHDPRARIDSLPGRGNPLELPQATIVSPQYFDPDRSFESWIEHQKDITPNHSTGWGGRVDQILFEEDEEVDDGDEDVDS